MTENKELIDSAKMELRNLEKEFLQNEAGKIYLCPKARNRRIIMQGLIDALEAPLEAVKWRPMSKAKDGTLILATNYDDQVPYDNQVPGTFDELSEVGFAQDLREHYEIWIPVPAKPQLSKDEKLACKVANELMSNWRVNEWNALNAAEAVIKIMKQ